MRSQIQEALAGLRDLAAYVAWDVRDMVSFAAERKRELAALVVGIALAYAAVILLAVLHSGGVI